MSQIAKLSDFAPLLEGWAPYGDGFAGFVGPLYTRQLGGLTAWGFLAEARHLNPAGNVHGGMLATFIDDAVSLAACSETGGIGQATIQLNIHFIGAVKEKEFVEAQCYVMRRARTVIFMRAECRVGQRVVATADGIWKLFG